MGDELELVDVPSSHETSGEFPADDVGAGELELEGDGPSSVETCGQFPANEVRATYPEDFQFHGDTQPLPKGLGEGTAPATTSSNPEAPPAPADPSTTPAA